jgi:hypothetical protein
MKFVLAILFIAIFATACMAQDNIIGVPLIIKKGETQKSGRLQIKYLGSLEGKSRHHFEVTDEGKLYEFKETSGFKINGLFVEIIEKTADDDAVKIIVMTEELFKKYSRNKLDKWLADYERSEKRRKELKDFFEENFPESNPIYANISIKKSVAEFSFFVKHSEKNDGDKFAEVFFKRIAVTNPTLNKSEMKMIPKKIGIVYRVKVTESKQKYTIYFTHLGNEYEGVIELNPTVTSELKQIKFYRKAD